jgi:hypothetical protein
MKNKEIKKGPGWIYWPLICLKVKTTIFGGELAKNKIHEYFKKVLKSLP